MKRFSLSFALSKCFMQIGHTFIMSFATVLAMVGSLLMLGTVSLIQYTVSYNMADLSTPNQAVVFLHTDCTDTDVEQVRFLLEELKNDKELSSFTFVSKEEALLTEMERFKEYPQLYQSLQIGDNPYRDSFELTAADHERVADIVEELQKFTVSRSTEGEEKPFAPIANAVFPDVVTETAESVMRTVRTIGLVLFTLLLLGGLFILINTVRLAIFDRSQELAVMRYVGATRAFMSAPFLVQGVVLGGGSAIAAFGIQWHLYEKIAAYIGATYSMITLISFEYLWYYILASFLFVGLLIGLVGGALSTVYYLPEKD